ncbi:hypothetical protein WOLCODRAFT_157489 [Wolfiporia cocos MD-104 SS10]|uniref:Uncharacterized protein n=1 Tax=Wolfiporia cocos (strain MD-104) TaxID=742152 RepID=A0A2H3J3I8_WOLCO|nr:hypothetical protein WOLCODRAFT_157489 [Wolfiporia cocos MD-104 SS10]
MGLIISGLRERRNKGKVAKANAAKRRTPEAASAPVRDDGQDYVHAIEATEGGGEVRSDPSSALQGEAQNLRAVEQTTRENSAVKSGAEGESAPRRESTLERVGEAQEVRNTEFGWRHIGRVPGAPDPAESDPSSKRPLQLPTEVCERMDAEMSVPDAATRHSVGSERRPRTCEASAGTATSPPASEIGGRAGWSEARRAGAYPAPGHDGRRQAATRVASCHQGAIWKPGDFHPLVFVRLSAFSSVTALRLSDVTFLKVREFGRLVCALPSLIRLRCENVLFTSTAPCASLAITRCPPSVRLTDLVILSDGETSSNVEANTALIGHLCTAGVAIDLQRFEFYAEAFSDSKYLEVYRESLHELFKQCSRSLRNVNLSPNLCRGKDRQTDAISDTIVGYVWMRCIIESNVSKNLREVPIVMHRPKYGQNAQENLQRTVSALRKDMYLQLNELFSNKDYEKLRQVDFVFRTHPDRVIPDATRWSTLLKAEMLRLDERGVLW